MTAEDNALRLLAGFDWKPQGKQLMANADFNEIDRIAIKEDLGKDGIEGIGLQFIGTKAYISAAAESLFRVEGMPLKICREAMAR
ncbi:hypothetical protein [Acidicapsa acidisoli]|uniref:hypothetical protein n=1 Tax=Acidicapsa acidisoli TaxID=1615681 RepID=UPI0021DFAE8C|nr:hypothetical protein [Acidicapsa acidisoli]